MRNNLAVRFMRLLCALLAALLLASCAKTAETDTSSTSTSAAASISSSSSSLPPSASSSISSSSEPPYVEPPDPPIEPDRVVRVDSGRLVCSVDGNIISSEYLYGLLAFAGNAALFGLPLHNSGNRGAETVQYVLCDLNTGEETPIGTLPGEQWWPYRSVLMQDRYFYRAYQTDDGSTLFRIDLRTGNIETLPDFALDSSSVMFTKLSDTVFFTLSGGPGLNSVVTRFDVATGQHEDIYHGADILDICAVDGSLFVEEYTSGRHAIVQLTPSGELVDVYDATLPFEYGTLPAPFAVAGDYILSQWALLKRAGDRYEFVTGPLLGFDINPSANVTDSAKQSRLFFMKDQVLYSFDVVSGQFTQYDIALDDERPRVFNLMCDDSGNVMLLLGADVPDAAKDMRYYYIPARDIQ